MNANLFEYFKFFCYVNNVAPLTKMKPSTHEFVRTKFKNIVDQLFQDFNRNSVK